MDRLKCKRCNGIKDGYWSPAKKEELVQRLAEYENTGLEPGEIRRQQSVPGWILVEDRLPEDDEMVLMQVSGKPMGNITLDNAFELGCYSEDEGWILEEYPEWEKPKVIAWQPLPEPYLSEKGEDNGKDETVL